MGEFAECLSLADKTFLCEIFGSIRENSGNLTIQDLVQRIDGATLIDEESVNALEQYSDAVILFMGAGDIQKIQRAYMEK